MDHLNLDSLGCIISNTSPYICLNVLDDPVVYDLLALNTTLTVEHNA